MKRCTLTCRWVSYFALLLIFGLINPKLYASNEKPSSQRLLLKKITCNQFLMRSNSGRSQAAASIPKSSLSVVANRLPVSLKRENSQWHATVSPGGLVSAMLGVGSQVEWIGWPGAAIPEHQKKNIEHILADAGKELKVNWMGPVFIGQEEVEQYYNGFANRIIWPSFHAHPHFVRLDPEYWSHYVKVNERFAQAAIDRLRAKAAAGVTEPQLVWVHDYHLFLVPEKMRKLLEAENFPFDVKIGFFLHIPFPGYELFKELPSEIRQSVLMGLLGADLVGVHGPDHLEALKQAYHRDLDVPMAGNFVRTTDRWTQLGVFPISIDPSRIRATLHDENFDREYEDIRQKYEGYHLLVGVDRLDYSKGLEQKLIGYRQFLEANPEYIGKVTLVQIAAPSRTGVEEYDETRERVMAEVERINQEFSVEGALPPVDFRFESYPIDYLTKLYRASDALLVTSIRDGMNLVCFECALAQEENLENASTLIVSEFAGAARWLTGAIQVNPRDTLEISRAIKRAITMNPEERHERGRSNHEFVVSYTVENWATKFLGTLLGTPMPLADAPNFDEKMLDDYKVAGQRVIFLDYDGTLVPFNTDPNAVKPSEQTLEVIKVLISDSSNRVFLISGRDRQYLNQYFPQEEFSELNVIAEHGGAMRNSVGEWEALVERGESYSKFIASEVLPYFSRLKDTYPGSLIEFTGDKISWHYRGVATEKINKDDVQIALDTLKDVIKKPDGPELQILHGEKVIEILPGGVSKGHAATKVLAGYNPDFILAIGDGETDETLFEALPSKSWTIKVADPATHARYFVNDMMAVRVLLNRLVEKRQ